MYLQNCEPSIQGARTEGPQSPSHPRTHSGTLQEESLLLCDCIPEMNKTTSKGSHCLIHAGDWDVC